MAAMPTAFHCPICGNDYSSYISFDSPDHGCCKLLTPHVIEKIAAARSEQHRKERRAAARALAIFGMPVDQF